MAPRFVSGPLSPTQGPKVQKSDFFTTKVKVEPKVKVIMVQTRMDEGPQWHFEDGFVLQSSYYHATPYLIRAPP